MPLYVGACRALDEKSAKSRKRRRDVAATIDGSSWLSTKPSKEKVVCPNRAPSQFSLKRAFNRRCGKQRRQNNLRTMSCTRKRPEDPGWERLRRSSSMGRYEDFKKHRQENTSQGSTVPKDLPLISHQNLVSHGLRKPDCNSTSHLRRGRE